MSKLVFILKLLQAQKGVMKFKRAREVIEYIAQHLSLAAHCIVKSSLLVWYRG